MAFNLSRVQRAAGDDARVMALGDGFPDGELPSRVEGVPVHLFQARHLLPMFEVSGITSATLLRTARRMMRGADLVHVHLMRDLVTLPAGAPRARVPDAAGRPDPRHDRPHREEGRPAHRPARGPQGAPRGRRRPAPHRDGAGRCERRRRPRPAHPHRTAGQRGPPAGAQARPRPRPPAHGALPRPDPGAQAARGLRLRDAARPRPPPGRPLRARRAGHRRTGKHPRTRPEAGCGRFPRPCRSAGARSGPRRRPRGRCVRAPGDRGAVPGLGAGGDVGRHPGRHHPHLRGRPPDAAGAGRAG